MKRLSRPDTRKGGEKTQTVFSFHLSSRRSKKKKGGEKKQKGSAVWVRRRAGREFRTSVCVQKVLEEARKLFGNVEVAKEGKDRYTKEEIAWGEGKRNWSRLEHGFTFAPASERICRHKRERKSAEPPIRKGRFGQGKKKGKDLSEGFTLELDYERCPKKNLAGPRIIAQGKVGGN